MINKIYPTYEAALDGITDGCSVMISGFGEVGLPSGLVDALADSGCHDLTIISNNAGYGPTGISRLFENSQVGKIICSYPRSGDGSWFERRYREGAVELQLVPQGTLTESIRAGGAGIAGFYTRTGVGTRFATGKSTLTLDGEVYLLERSITADFALIKGHRGDRWGNITYRKAARNYGPSMATAGRVTIVEVDEIAELGEQDPEAVVTPGIYVDRVVRNQAKLGVGMVSLSQRGWTAEMIAARVYGDLPDGAYVNLGIGLPNRILGVAHDPAKEVVFHSENGILGLGERPADDDVDPDLIDSGKNFASLIPGGSFFSHVDSFAMIRGGHIQIAVLGAYEVSAAGDIANWTSDAGAADIPAIGGAADLAIGAGTVFVMMSNTSRGGIPRLVRNCSLPVTASGAVSRVYTDLGVFAPEKTHFRVLELAPAISLRDIQSQVEPGLIQHPDTPG